MYFYKPEAPEEAKYEYKKIKVPDARICSTKSPVGIKQADMTKYFWEKSSFTVIQTCTYVAKAK